MDALRFVGDPFSVSGYSEHIRELILALLKLGVDISIDYRQQDPIQLNGDYVQQLKPLVGKQNNAKISVYVTNPAVVHKENEKIIAVSTFETNGLPKPWVENLNRVADVVVVPSRFNEHTFVAAGVEKPVVSCFEGYDTQYFNTDIAPLNLRLGDDVFKFITMCSWIYRKAWDRLLVAYLAEFRHNEKVALVIKVHGNINDPRFLKSVRENIKLIKQSMGFVDAGGNQVRPSPPIYVLWNILVPKQLAEVYRGCDAYVSPSRGEGWNRGVVHAAACGLPVIATDWGAHTDYLDELNAYLVDYALSPCVIPGPNATPYTPDMLWADIDIQDLRHTMRQVIQDKIDDELRLATDVVFPAFTWENAAKQFIKVTEEQL